MVTILKENKPISTSERFLRAFQGAGAGIPEALNIYEKDLERQETKLAKRKAKIPGAIKTHLSLYDPNKAFMLNPESMAKLDELTRKYSEKGLDPHEAVKIAHEEIMAEGERANNPLGAQRSLMGQNVSTEKSMAKAGGGFFGLPQVGPEVTTEQKREGTKKFAAKIGRPVVGLLDFPAAFSKKYGQTGYESTGSPFAVGGRTEKSKAATEELRNSKTLTDYYDQLTGGRGIPENIGEEIAGGAVLGVPGVIASATQVALRELGAPESLQDAVGFLTLILAQRAGPGGTGLLKDVQKAAKERGIGPEEVLAKAYEASEVNPQDIASGDPQAIRSLKEKITNPPEISEKVKVTPKNVFNKKAALKEREVFGRKLADSPLEAHYEIEARNIAKEAGKGSEVRAREQATRERLAPEEKKLFEDIRYKQEQLLRIEKERQQSLDPDAKARLNVNYDYQVKAIEKATEKLKDIQYEMKYGRARPTEAEIDSQIKKSLDKYEEGIKNPTETTAKDLKRQLELDKQYIDRASKIIERGELPGEIRPDTFIKMKDKYLQSYKTAIKESKDAIRALKGEKDAASIRSLREKEDLVDILNNRVKRLEADIVNQTDNIKSMRALEKPSGAFYKNQIKSLKKDQALFKHDLFQNKVAKSPLEARTEQAFKETSSQFKKGKELFEHPTKENIKEISNETGKSEESIRDHLKKGREEASGIKEEIKKGTVTPNTESKIFKFGKKMVVGLGTSFGIGAFIGLVEEILGTSINPTFMRRLTSSFGFASFGSTTVGKNFIRDKFDEAQSRRLEELKSNPVEWNKYINNIRRSHGEKKVRRILKIYKSGQ